MYAFTLNNALSFADPEGLDANGWGMTGSFGEFAVCGGAENYGGCLLGLHANAHDAGVANSVALAALNTRVANGLGQPAGAPDPYRQQCGDGPDDSCGDDPFRPPSVPRPGDYEKEVIGSLARSSKHVVSAGKTINRYRKLLICDGAVECGAFLATGWAAAGLGIIGRGAAALYKLQAAGRAINFTGKMIRKARRIAKGKEIKKIDTLVDRFGGHKDAWRK